MNVTIGYLNRYGRSVLAPILTTSVTVAPLSYPVGDGIVKAFLRIDADDTSQDDVIDALTGAATEAVQDYANVSLVEQERMVVFGASDFAEIPFSPVISVDLVEKQDVADGTWSTTTEFVYRGDSFITFDTYGVYRVSYTAGFTAIPDTFKTAVLRHVKEHYEIRMATALDMTSNMIDGMSWRDAAQPKKKYSL